MWKQKSKTGGGASCPFLKVTVIIYPYKIGSVLYVYFIFFLLNFIEFYRAKQDIVYETIETTNSKLFPQKFIRIFHKQSSTEYSIQIP